MAKIKDVLLRFDHLDGADGYRVYWREGDTVSQNDLNVDVGYVNEGISMYELLGDVDSTFTVGVVPYDDAGNEGDITVIGTRPFDFVPPTGVITGGEFYSEP